MARGRTRYEIVVATLLNEASLAAFRLPSTASVVPRRTTRRLRIPADRDLPVVLDRLTDHDLQVLEIRRCFEQPAARARTGGGAASEEVGGPAEAGADVIAFPAARAAARWLRGRDEAGPSGPADEAFPAPRAVGTGIAPARRPRWRHAQRRGVWH